MRESPSSILPTPTSSTPARPVTTSLLIARGVDTYPGETDNVLIATKAGTLRPGDGTWYQNGDPAYLKQAAKASALRIGVDSIGLLQFHRPDPRVPFADSLGAFAELLDEGVIRQAGVSNVNPDQIREANEVLGGRLASVQNQFSPAFVSSYPELEVCVEPGHCLPSLESTGWDGEGRGHRLPRCPLPAGGRCARRLGSAGGPGLGVGAC
ncbi:hypothetical protein GCM10025876_27830 [Demequina litorisediminis]|uniref:NADP-dependent oxidoreductase domain-containing protein n=1 Tax=Demequina litorisediminis TaxID=1849022 RepID=A0ABQ6IFB0_9MICO|nr:hypothetical protein GCM10025876_27830 [Demequina litorisediminis]